MIISAVGSVRNVNYVLNVGIKLIMKEIHLVLFVGLI